MDRLDPYLFLYLPNERDTDNTVPHIFLTYGKDLLSLHSVVLHQDSGPIPLTGSTPKPSFLFLLLFLPQDLPIMFNSHYHQCSGLNYLLIYNTINRTAKLKRTEISRTHGGLSLLYSITGDQKNIASIPYFLSIIKKKVTGNNTPPSTSGP